MDRELIFIILLPLSSFLWMVGGWKWKWVRRYLLPVCMFAVAVAFGADISKSLLMAVLGMFSFSLPYGSNHTWGMRIFTALTFGVVSMPLGFTWWQVSAPIVFLTTWVLSNNKTDWQWKICEAMTGFAVVLPLTVLLY